MAMTVLLIYFVIVLLITIKLVNIMRARVKVHPVLHFTKNKLTDYLLEHCASLTEPFTPPRWLQNRHLQTILPGFISMYINHGIVFKRELVTVDDGEKVALDWAVQKDKQPPPDIPDSQKDIIIILPGLTAGPSGFTGTAQLALNHGFNVAVLSKRGHAGAKLSKPFLRGFGDGSDLHSVLTILKSRYQQVKIAVIGSSAGSAVAGAYIGEYGNRSMLDACVSISAGFAVERLFSQPPYSKFYEFLMVEAIKRRVLQPNIDCLSEIIDPKVIKNARTIYEIEENVYSRSYGYENMAEYWQNNQPKWCSVDIPRLFFNSMDDPICVPDLIPFDNFKAYENAILMATDKGGHCGFIEDLSGMHWTDRVAIDFIKTVFKMGEH